MLDPSILFSSVLNGLTTGAVYALIALGLTLIYGVLHIINFAHGASLMLALYAVYMLKERLGIDPYMALPIVVPGMFVLGYALQRIIINRHALKNAMLPVVTVIGIEFAFLLGGLVVTEQVFNLNGIGRLMVLSVQNQDYTLTQALVMLVVTIAVLSNLVVDLLYAWLDPRIALA